MDDPADESILPPVLEHGDWIQIYVDPDPAGGPGFIRIEERHGAPGVVVLPITDRGRIGLVRVQRRLLGRACWEAPRGFGGEAESTRSDASRELWEETGIRLGPEQLMELGKVAPNSGVLRSEVHAFAAVLPDDLPDATVPDADEIDAFRWFEPAEVADLVRTGELGDGFTLSLLLKAVLIGLVQLPVNPADA
jgi:ADP-ribose pyrophosphatase